MININSKGQFFSPDLVIAVLIFVICLSFFFIGSDSVFRSVSLSESKNKADEVIHSTMNVLVYSSGQPVNWETKTIDEIVFFGLVSEENIVSEQKLLALVNHLDNNYLIAKEKIGFGPYSFKIQLFDSSGFLLSHYSSSNTFTDSEFELNYDRIVLFNGELCTLRGVIALEE